MTDETRARFLAAIAAQVPADRIAEVHLFPAIRQGGMESGVAVVAVDLVRAIDAGAAETPAPEREHGLAASDDAPATENADDSAALAADDTDALGADDAEGADRRPAPPPRRYTVFSARYRHTLKGPERGKWETSVIEEADAPLLTVDAVVRGVQRSSGEVDEIVRLSGEEVRAALPTPASP